MNFPTPYFKSPPSKNWQARYTAWRNAQPEFQAFLEGAKNSKGNNATITRDELYALANAAGVSVNEANTLTNLRAEVSEDITVLIARHEKAKVEYAEAVKHVDDLIKRLESEVLSIADRAKLEDETRRAIEDRNRLMLANGAARVARRKAEALAEMVAA